MKNIKARNTDEQLEGCLQITATEIRPDIGRLLKQKQCKISHK
jgi:hypothetical protein